MEHAKSIDLPVLQDYELLEQEVEVIQDFISSNDASSTVSIGGKGTGETVNGKHGNEDDNPYTDCTSRNETLDEL